MSKKDLKSLIKHSNLYLGENIDGRKYSNLHQIYSICSNPISIRKCSMNELSATEFQFYLNNNVKIIEMVVTEVSFERFLRILKTAAHNNYINELNISIGNSAYLIPLLN